MGNNGRYLAAGIAFVGLVSFGIGTAIALRQPTPNLQQLGTELEAKIRDTATAVHARGETLAALPTLKDAVSTDAATVRDESQRELMLRPLPTETITIAQVDHADRVSVLLVLPEGHAPATRIDKSGARLDVGPDALWVTDVFPVVPTEPERAAELRGALAISSSIDLKAFVEHLGAAGVGARVQIGEHTLLLGSHAPGVNELSTPVVIPAPLGRGTQIALLTPSPVGFPFRVLGGLLGALALLVGLLARMPARTRPASLDADTVRSHPGSATPRVATPVGVGMVVDSSYQIEKLLGQGSMGTVWEARHLRLPKRVALKFLNVAIDQPQFDFMGRFRREAEITAQLGHPNIVGVIDFNKLPSGMPYIVLEYLEGESLGERIFRGPIPLDEALEYATQIGSALHAAHRAGVVHRDLKPDNVHLVPTEGGRPTVKVLDFGISKMRDGVSAHTQEATVLGTPQYMSPEQANGKNSEVDARTDLWALAAIVHEMIVGKPAFVGETMTQLLVSVLVKPAPSLRDRTDVPAHVSAAIDRALQKDPAARFPDVPSFIAALTQSPSS